MQNTAHYIHLAKRGNMAFKLNQIHNQSEEDLGQHCDYLLEIEREAELNRNLSQMAPHIGLKKVRHALGKTQIEMAGIMSVSRRSYIDYEHGAKPIPSTPIMRLKALYYIDLNKLFLGLEPDISQDYPTEIIASFRKVFQYFSQTYAEASPTDVMDMAVVFLKSAPDPKNVNMDELTIEANMFGRDLLDFED